MNQILNKKHDVIPKDAVYIGRPSKWGNPFEIGNDGTRSEVLEKYTKWILQNPDLIQQAKVEIGNRPMVCWCSPAKCHAEILSKLIHDEPVEVTPTINLSLFS